MKLTAATTGTYAGIVLDQDANDTQTVTLSGNTLTLTGTVYAPKAPLVLSGNAQLNATLDVDLLTLSGNAVDNAVGGGGAQGGDGPRAEPAILSPTVEQEIVLRTSDGLFALPGQTLGSSVAPPAQLLDPGMRGPVALPLRARETEAVFATQAFASAHNVVHRASLDQGMADAGQGWLAASLLDQLAHETVR
jgi:hypothetical protein